MNTKAMHLSTQLFHVTGVRETLRLVIASQFYEEKHSLTDNYGELGMVDGGRPTFNGQRIFIANENSKVATKPP